MPAASIPYRVSRRCPGEMLSRGRELFDRYDARRSVRDFSPDAVPREIIEIAMRAASTAPSGAHRQPWTFVAVADPAVKHAIRVAAEAEERENYEGGRMSAEWLAALEPLGTDWRKPFLETAPWLVVLFEQTHGVAADGSAIKHFYVRESVGIACGLFIAAIHELGLATLTHTPSPMAFLNRILGRGENERPFALLPIGYPANEATVPSLRRKSLDEISVWFE